MKSFIEGNKFYIFWILKDDNVLVDADNTPTFSISYFDELGTKTDILTDIEFVKSSTGVYYYEGTPTISFPVNKELLISKSCVYGGETIPTFETMIYNSTDNEPVAKFN